MEKRITYLFGAGASAQALSVVKDFTNDFTNLLEMLDIDLDFGLDTVHNKPNSEKISILLDEFKENLKWLIKEAKDHASVDTFAKKLYLLWNWADYSRLKKTLSTFFVIYQSLNKKGIDKRYDLFLATLLSNKNGELSLPTNVSILSWNYDTQFEISYSNFLKNSFDGAAIEKGLRINKLVDINEFNYRKLNGTAGVIIENLGNKPKRYHVPPVHKSQEEDMVDHAKEVVRTGITHFALCENENFPSTLIFSWEPEVNGRILREDANNICNSTDILIVIGYSFPTFNRQIDKVLINNVENAKGRIVVQAPKGSHTSTMERIHSLCNEKLEKYRVPVSAREDIDEFYIPEEIG